MLFLTMEPSSLPVVLAQPDEKHANRTEQLQSGSNEVVVRKEENLLSIILTKNKRLAWIHRVQHKTD